MIILVPMGGKGTRFSNAGYTTNKACIPTTDRHSGQKLPMIVCALKDMPGINDPENKIICVDRDLHENNGTERIILEHFPNVVFIHDHVMLDQAFGCFLAREFLMTNEELFIGSCDNGFDYDNDAFDRAREHYDVLMISHTADVNIAQNPKAHSWAALDAEGKYLTAISLKDNNGISLLIIAYKSFSSLKIVLIQYSSSRDILNTSFILVWSLNSISIIGIG